jgi:hypothetical protein
MRLTIPQLMVICILFCCYTFKHTSSIESRTIISNRTATVTTDSAAVTKSIIDFLRWYKTKLNKANSFPLLAKDNKDYFMVNKKACSDYLNFLKSSSFISQKYVSYWQTYFDDKAAMLEKVKVQSDIPEGFDMDFVLFTQEPDLVLDKLDSLKLKIVSIDKTVASVELTLPSDSSIQYEFEMNKSKDGWQIEYISTSNFD